MKRKIFSILFVLVLAVSLMVVPAALVGASPGLGLVGQWHFDEGAGTDAYDSSGTTPPNDGTIYGATWVPGKFGNALSFDGADDIVTIPHSTSLDLGTVITVEVWLNADSLAGSPGSQNGIIRKGLLSDEVTKSWGLDIQNKDGANKARFFIYDEGTYYIAYSAAVSTGAWHHLVGTYDGSTVDIYLDGSNTSSTPAIHSGDIDTNTEDIVIGKRDGGRFFDGIIDEVRIWDRALTAIEIANTPMSKFEIDHAKINFKNPDDDDKVRVKGKLELDLVYGDNVSISEDVTVTVGPFSAIIPGNTMEVKGENGEKWEYKRPIDDPAIIKHMTINWKNGKFNFSMDKADLSKLTNPKEVTISIQIGDDYGYEIITMKEKKHWDYKAPHD